MEIRRLSDHDLADYERAMREAFGSSPLRPALWSLERATPYALGAFDEGALIATAASHPLALRLGERTLPAAGVCDVTVALPHRGRGLATRMMRELLTRQSDSGALFSLLYPAAPAIYRPLGYAIVAQRDAVRIPSADLLRARRSQALRGRILDPEDDRSRAEALEAATRGLNGVVGPLARPTGATVDLVIEGPAESEEAPSSDGIRAFTRFTREGATLTCDFLHSLDAEAWEHALALLASHTGIDTVEIYGAPHDSAWHWLSANASLGARVTPMARVLDLAAALEARPWSEGISGHWRFAVRDGLFSANTGVFVLELDDGRARAHRESANPGTRTVHGIDSLSALVAGIRTPVDRHFPPLPEDLIRAARIAPWSMSHGF